MRFYPAAMQKELRHEDVTRGGWEMPGPAAEEEEDEELTADKSPGIFIHNGTENLTDSLVILQQNDFAVSVNGYLINI